MRLRERNADSVTSWRRAARRAGAGCGVTANVSPHRHSCRILHVALVEGAGLGHGALERGMLRPRKWSPGPRRAARGGGAEGLQAQWLAWPHHRRRRDRRAASAGAGRVSLRESASCPGGPATAAIGRPQASARLHGALPQTARDGSGLQRCNIRRCPWNVHEACQCDPNALGRRVLGAPASQSRSRVRQREEGRTSEMRRAEPNLQETASWINGTPSEWLSREQTRFPRQRSQSSRRRTGARIGDGTSRASLARRP